MPNEFARIIIMSRAVTIVYYVTECIDFCQLQIRLILYDKFIQICAKIK